MDIQTIDKNLLSDLHQKAVANERKRMNFDLRTSALDQSQRMLNALEPGTILPIHRHPHTAETYLLLRGKIRVMFYNDKKEETESTLLDPLAGSFGVHIPANQWHTLEVLDSGSVLFEVKDGPYTPLGENDLLK